MYVSITVYAFVHSPHIDGLRAQVNGPARPGGCGSTRSPPAVREWAGVLIFMLYSVCYTQAQTDWPYTGTDRHEGAPTKRGRHACGASSRGASIRRPHMLSRSVLRLDVVGELLAFSSSCKRPPHTNCGLRDVGSRHRLSPGHAHERKDGDYLKTSLMAPSFSFWRTWPALRVLSTSH